eukprot:TRINITY_DN3561_c0_g1_i1.p1 TRINITY_DN3561_c0_g1~~TRINITY_DN3561_c0_g1_i1.p1  ORF type:complete len:245 (+),score=41.78 TRINITY_DN3561_c0_g1_i1:116-850(+)
MVFIGAILAMTAAIISGAQGQGMTPPLLPEEFAGNIIQNKYNSNGHRINHTCSGTYYSSVKHNSVRADCTTVGMISNDMTKPSPLGAVFMSSVTNFTSNVNTVISWVNMAAQPTCYSGPQAWLPPFPANFLSLVGAIYAGLENTPAATLEKWIFMVSSLVDTVFTFFFDVNTRQLQRLEFFAGFTPSNNTSRQVQVGVHQTFYNFITGNSSMLDHHVFNMSTCSADHHSVDAKSAAYNPLSIRL